MAASGNNSVLYAIMVGLATVVAGGAYYIVANSPHTPETKVVTPVAIPAQTAPPTASTQPLPPSGDADSSALAESINRSIATGDFTNADRFLADANQRYSGNAVWPSLQQKLAKARVEREVQLRQAEARRLITEARHYAQVGDFGDAESMLQEAGRQAPKFPEIALASNDIALLSAERGERYRERYQYEAAVDQALTFATAGKKSASDDVRSIARERGQYKVVL